MTEATGAGPWSWRGLLTTILLCLTLIEPYGSGLVPGGDARLRAMLLFAPYVMAFLFVAVDRGRLRAAGRRPVVWMTLAGGWLLITGPAGLLPTVDVALGFGFLALVVYGAFAGQQWDSLRSSLFWALSLTLVWSLAAILVSPAAVTVEGRWRGVFGGANGLGFACALAILLGIDRWSRHGRGGLVLAGTAVVILIRTDSRTSMVAAVAAVAIWAAPVLPRLLLPAVALLMPVIAVLVALPETSTSVAEVISRSGDPQEVTSVTGRTYIWRVGLREWAERPLIGYGAGSTSEVYAAAPVADYEEHFQIETAHNLWLQLALNGGLVAVVLMVAGVVGTGLRLLISAVGGQPVLDQLAVLVALLIHGLTEDVVREPKATLIVLAGLATASVTRPPADDGDSGRRPRPGQRGQGVRRSSGGRAAVAA